LEVLGLIMINPSISFWANKKVLITGHTGFKGCWLSIWLHSLGAKVTGVSLEPNTKDNLFELGEIGSFVDTHIEDIRNFENIESIFKKADPEIVFHMAAQPLVSIGYENPLLTFSTNIMGTANVLSALQNVKSLKAIVTVTTDKVYKNNEWIWPYRENDTLGGYDPYSASKAASEMVIDSYAKSFFNAIHIPIGIGRAGNVIGGGDWSKDRLVPDIIRSWVQDSPLVIRRPNSIRPWQHVLEPLNGYLVLAERMYSDANLMGAYNFGPLLSDAQSVRYLVDESIKVLKNSVNVLYDDVMSGPHEANLLTLDSSKAKSLLGVIPRWTLDVALKKTIEWYVNQANTNTNSIDLCLRDIESFTNGVH